MAPTVRCTLRMAKLPATGRLLLERGLGAGDQLVIERLVQPVILRLHAAARDARGQRGRVEDRREIEPLAFQ